jgi:hypothetical protein
VNFEVPKAATMRTTVLWYVTPCSLVAWCQRVAGIPGLIILVKKPQFRTISFVSGGTLLILICLPVQFPNQKDSLFAINGRKITAQLIPIEGHQESWKMIIHKTPNLILQS